MKKTLITIIMAFLFCSTLMAQDNELDRQSMKGLDGVHVGVDLADLSPGVKADGLSKNQIQTGVELRLRMAGIKLFTEAQAHAEPKRIPLLSVSLYTLKRDELYLYHSNIALYQTVRLDRDPKINLFFVAWSTERFGAVSAKELSELRDYIKDGIDKFINAWLSVNPKP